MPRATRFGVLWTPTAPSGRPFVQAAEDTGGKLGVQLLAVSVRTVAEFDGAFARMAQGRAGGVQTMPFNTSRLLGPWTAMLQSWSVEDLTQALRPRAAAWSRSHLPVNSSPLMRR